MVAETPWMNMLNCRTCRNTCDYVHRTVIVPRPCPSQGIKLPLTLAIKPLSAVWQAIHLVLFSRTDHICASQADDENQCQNLFQRIQFNLSLHWICLRERHTAEPSFQIRTTKGKCRKSRVLDKKRDKTSEWSLTLLQRFSDNPQDTTSPETPRHQQDGGRSILERVTVTVSPPGSSVIL